MALLSQDNNIQKVPVGQPQVPLGSDDHRQIRKDSDAGPATCDAHTKWTARLLSFWLEPGRFTFGFFALP